MYVPFAPMIECNEYQRMYSRKPDQELIPHFSSKGVICNATTERGDGLYSAYCPLPNDEARTQMMTFLGKFFVKRH